MRTAENLRFFFYAENDPADRHHGIKSTEKREEFSLDIARFV
jgi:hypothetical protein